MELLQAFNPITAKSGQFIASSLQVGSKLVVRNKSYVDVQLIFSNSATTGPIILANESRAFIFSDSSSVPNGFITWIQVNIDYPQTVIQLENIVYVEMYGPGEKISETYPAPIQRESVPSLLPYNVGAGWGQIGISTPSAGLQPTIFPTSYDGVTCAPQSISGSGFDHYYSFYVLGNMSDVPGLYSGTKKTGSDAVLSTEVGGSITTIPGPFSLPGLTSVDTANQYNHAWFDTTFDIPIATQTTWYIDCFVKFTQFTSITNQCMIHDQNPIGNGAGFALGVDSNGFVVFYVAYTGGLLTITSPNPLSLNAWHLVAVECVGSNVYNLSVDGAIVATGTASGTGKNGANHVSFGSDYVTGARGFIGQMGNIGIALFSPSAITRNGFSVPQGAPFRYALAQQSLNIDVQSAWITGFDYISAPETTPTFRSFAISLPGTGLFNPGGLFFTNNVAAQTVLHKIYLQTAPAQLVYTYQTSASQTVMIQRTFPHALGQISQGNFIVMQPPTSGPQYDINVYGYNILGIA